MTRALCEIATVVEGVGICGLLAVIDAQRRILKSVPDLVAQSMSGRAVKKDNDE